MTTVVSCPTCGAKVTWVPENTYRPFCSDRCKQIDLGAWAEEKYTIPAVNLPEDPDNPDLGSANDQAIS